MVEEIIYYKAPIAVIPEISLAKSDLHKWEKKRKRCSKEDTLKMCDIEIARAQARVDALKQSKG